MLTTESGNARLARFTSTMTPALHALIENLILYEELVVPTQDFLIIPALHRALGEPSLRALLESRAIRFCRMKGMIAFSPTAGLFPGAINRSDGQTYPFAADIDWTVAWACNDFARATDPDPLVSAIHSVTTEVESTMVVSSISSEVTADLIDSAELRNCFGLPADWRRPELPGNTVHLYGGPTIPSAHPEIDAVLAAAQCNAEIDLANRAKCNDIASATPLDAVLRAKTRREGRHEIGAALLDVADLPNFAPLVLDGRFPLSDLLKLRESRDAKEFRRFFHDNFDSPDTKDITDAYYALLRDVRDLDSTAGRILRALFWTGASTAAGLTAGGALGAAVGVAGSLVDSFLVSKIRLSGSPKLFLDRLRLASNEASNSR